MWCPCFGVKSSKSNPCVWMYMHMYMLPDSFGPTSIYIIKCFTCIRHPQADGPPCTCSQVPARLVTCMSSSCVSSIINALDTTIWRIPISNCICRRWHSSRSAQLNLTTDFEVESYLASWTSLHSLLTLHPSFFCDNHAHVFAVVYYNWY